MPSKIIYDSKYKTCTIDLAQTDIYYKNNSFNINLLLNNNCKIIIETISKRVLSDLNINMLLFKGFEKTYLL